MFSAALLLSLSTLALGMTTGDLKVSVNALSGQFSSIEDIIISAVVSNPTDKDIRVFAKNNVLDNTATGSFSVSKNGSSVLFTGIRASYDLSEDSLYTTIPAGSSVAVNHTGLSSLYDFETHGTGKFTFTPNTVFQTAPDDPIIQVSTDAIDIDITNDVQKRELLPGLQRRTSTPSCSDASRLQVLEDSFAYARSLAGGAATDIRSHPTGPEWTSYFNGNSQDTIWYRMDLIAGDLSTAGTRSIYCDSDPAGICTGGTIAYTLIVTSGGAIVGSNIYTCDYFFTSTGTTPGICTGGYDATQSSRGGVLLHEMSHATSGTSDIAYGCTACAALSVTDKLNNADNYRCMGLAIYKDYDC